MSNSDSTHTRQLHDEDAARPDGMYISQVARIIGVSAATIRAWERERLITPRRSPSGYRTYSAVDVERLQKIRDLNQVRNFNASAVRNELARHDGKTDSSLHAEISPSSPPLRHRVYYMRKRQNMTLRELAAATGLSASALSAVERGASTPSVDTLRRLAEAFDTSVPGLLGIAPNANVVVHPHERQELDLDIPGVRYESLFSQSVSLQSMLIHFEPGAGSDEPYAHEGEEFLYLLKGSINLTLEAGDQHDLHAGDAATYLSTRPHRLRNVGREPTEILWVQTPPSI